MRLQQPPCFSTTEMFSGSFFCFSLRRSPSWHQHMQYVLSLCSVQVSSPNRKFIAGIEALFLNFSFALSWDCSNPKTVCLPNLLNTALFVSPGASTCLLLLYTSFIRKYSEPPMAYFLLRLLRRSGFLRFWRFAFRCHSAPLWSTMSVISTVILHICGSRLYPAFA